MPNPRRCARPNCNGNVFRETDEWGVVEDVCSLCSRRVVLFRPTRWPDPEWLPSWMRPAVGG